MSRPMRHWFPVAIFLALVALSPVANAAERPTATTILKKAVPYYYQSPDRNVVEALLDGLDGLAADRDNNGSLVGFLSEVMRRNPHLVATMASRDFKRPGQVIIAESLWLAGEAARAEAYAKRNGWSEDHLARLRRMPGSVKSSVITHSNDLDLHWGAFFASGDVQYIAKIADQADIAAASGIPIGIIIEGAARIAQRLPIKHLFGAIDTNDRMARTRFLLGLVGLWAIESNAARHPAIRDYISKRLLADTIAPGALAMRWVQFKVAHPELTVSARGAAMDLMVMLGRDTETGAAFVAETAPGSPMTRFTSRIMNEVPPGRPVFLHQVVLRKMPCEARSRISLTAPDGTTWRYSIAATPNTDDKPSIENLWQKIEADRLSQTGTYRYSARITGCGETVGPVTNGIFRY